MALEDQIEKLHQAIVDLRAVIERQVSDIAGTLQGAESPHTPAPQRPTAAESLGAAKGALESPDRDADGLPWDERIHSSSKARNADGRWKAKRGVPADVVERVRAELRGGAGQTTGQVTGSAPVPAPAASQTPFTSQGPATTATGPSFDEVKVRAASCARVLGVNAGKITQLLSRFGVDRLSSLAPEFYGKFVDGLARLEQGGEP